MRRPVLSLVARILAVPFVVALVVLLLSDRAPAATRHGLAKGLIVGRKVEGRTGIDLIDHSDIPFSWEQLGHAGLWGVAVVLAYLVFANRVSILQVGSGVFAASATFELGQFFFTATRHLEWADLGANLVGILGGCVAASAIALIETRVRRPGVAARNITG